MTEHKLNEEQEFAISQDGNVLLIACAGSGKTRVVVHKIVRELRAIEESQSKQKVVALTFTHRAADEILKRINHIGISSNSLWIGTIHSFCLEWIIKPYSCYLDQTKDGFTIIDEVLAGDIIRKLREKHRIKSYGLNTKINRDGSFFESDTSLINLLNEYHEILKSHKMIDFDQILYLAYSILFSSKNISENLSNIFKTIIADEYQDIQDLQYAIISSIVNSRNGKTNIFFVGDPDQAIYTSLGGVYKNIREIKQEFNDLEITQISLSGNYRSNQRIINYSRFFQTTTRGDIIALGQNKDNAGVITIDNGTHCDNMLDEITRIIRINLNKGVPENEICILIPQWVLIRTLARKLRLMMPDVNFDASGMTPLSQNKYNIWNKLSKLFLTNPNPKIYSYRLRWASEVIEELQDCTDSILMPPANEAKGFLKTINSISSDKDDGIEYLDECFSQLIDVLNINMSIHKTLIEKKDIFFNGVRDRITADNAPSDINSFKNFYREASGIVINTCVGVKGEEFETVIAFGLLHGYVPHWNEIKKNEHEATISAKRLLYVICSRAKNNLHLICETGRTNARGEFEQNKILAGITGYPYDNLPH